MTPTTPTDRFTKLSVSSRRAKGDAYLHRRLKSIHTHRREGVLAGERTPRSAGLVGFAHRVLSETARIEDEGRKVSLLFKTYPITVTHTRSPQVVDAPRTEHSVARVERERLNGTTE